MPSRLRAIARVFALIVIPACATTRPSTRYHATAFPPSPSTSTNAASADVRAMARTQIYVALRKLDESEQVFGLFRERLLAVAKRQIDAAQAGFVTSQNPFMAVIEAEKNLRSVELDYQFAQAECDRRHAELDRALGRIPGVDVQETDR